VPDPRSRRTAAPRHEDLHEWVSFVDPDEERTWVFDLTFLTSPWTCIFGQGCPGVLTEAATELVQGCCSYGAHFVDEDDRARVELISKRLTPEQWQFKAESDRKGGPTKVTKDGEIVTRLADDACLFLNRPGFAKGPGCALHVAAVEAGESFIPWKPEVCWQLPLRRTDETDDHGHVTSTVREWKRRDWGEGGADFHWWCTETHEAFVGREPVYVSLRDELVELTSERAYGLLLDHLVEREVLARTHGTVAFLPHPALRTR
jgi:hypothetical protein